MANEFRITVLVITFKNMEYEVDDGKRCQKSNMSGKVMIKQCIKDNDKLLYSGMVGDAIMTDTYNTSLDENFNNMRATIQRDTCLPIHLVNNQYGSMFEADIFNITPGIKDKKIFEEPLQCKHVRVQQRNPEEENHPLASVVRKFLKQGLLSGKINTT